VAYAIQMRTRQFDRIIPSYQRVKLRLGGKSGGLGYIPLKPWDNPTPIWDGLG